MRHLPLVAALLLVSCGGAETTTQKRMFDWAQALNVHLATDLDGGNVYPQRLREVDATMRDHLSLEDGWGRPFAYRRLSGEKYQILSGGPNGEVGDDDDVVVENGILRPAAEVYAERPYRSGG